ncbi:MAG TPA: protein kinase [Planctomycetota bacterium]
MAETLGEWCVRAGLATAEEIEHCLRIQSAAEKSGLTPPPRLGEILVVRGILTQNQVAEALAAQRKEIRSCAQCGIQINVPVRGDVASYLCGRCRGPLQAPAGPPPLRAVDEEFILVSRDPVPEDVERALKVPSARFGKYVLLKPIGEGGIGVVYLAWDTYLSQYVALKRLRAARPLSPQDTPNEHVQSLLKEARNSIRLRHPGVVSVFDVGRVGREYYVAMEYLEGDTLADRMRAARQNGRPSPYHETPRETIRQLIEIARAVEYAHGRPSPIVHCDLKPANILIDRDSRPHVLDFGLARNLELDKPEKGEISGTPSYMAPEQASGESDKIDRRTDVYAFGAILYEMLAGRPPFVGETLDVLGRTIGEAPDRPSDILRKAGRPPAELPPALEELCLRCLRKDRSERPQTMEEVALALDAHAASLKTPSTVLLKPLGRPERSRPNFRRLALLAASAAILLGGSALVLSWRAAPDERREADILQALAKFQPGAARALAIAYRDAARGGPREARAAGLAEEADWMARLQGRVAQCLAARPLDLPDPRYAGATLRIVGADAAGLRIADSSRGLPWASLDAGALIDLLLAALERPEDADLLALGILALRAGRTAEADLFFERLRTSALGPISQRYQDGHLRK